MDLGSLGGVSDYLLSVRLGVAGSASFTWFVCVSAVSSVEYTSVTFLREVFGPYLIPPFHPPPVVSVPAPPLCHPKMCHVTCETEWENYLFLENGILLFKLPLKERWIVFLFALFKRNLM